MGVKTILITVVIIIIALVCLEFLIPTPPIECNFANTVNITAGHRFPNGSIKFENIIYDKGFYKDYDFFVDKDREKTTVEKHIRGCLCAIKSCIRICNDYADDHHIKVYNEDEIEHKINLKNNTDYHIMTHRPCYEMYEMDEEDDKWLFLKNGSLKTNYEQMLHSHHYCFSNETEADHKTIVNVCVDSTIDEDEGRTNLNDTKMILNIVGMFISLPFLLVTLFIYGWIPELHGNVHGKTLMSYIVSLMFLFFFLTLVQLDNSMFSGTFYCKFSGYATYFWVIMCFFWLNVMCYEIWSAFRGRTHGYRNLTEHKRFSVYCLYAFGSTTLLTLIVFFVDEVFDVPKDFKPIIGIETCWIRKDRFVEFLYLYLPITIISVVNIVLYSMTAYTIYMYQKEVALTRTEASQKNSSIHADKDRFYIYLRLFIIMGVAWAMESVSWAFKNSLFLFILTDAINCFQGIIIFFLFVWKPKVIELIKNRWRSSSLCCLKSRADNSAWPDETTKISSDDFETRGNFIID